MIVIGLVVGVAACSWPGKHSLATSFSDRFGIPQLPRLPPAPQRPATAEPFRVTRTFVTFLPSQIVGGVPFKAQSPVVVRIGIEDLGERAQSIRLHTWALVSDLPATKASEETIWDRFLVKVRNARPMTIEFGNLNYRFVDVETPPLSVDERRHLEAGDYETYVVGLALYRDAVGEFETELCGHFEVRDNSRTGWWRCDEHNRHGVQR